MSAIAHISGYQITEQIYRGNRTLVYRGVRTNDQKPVVIKILRNEYPNVNELVQFRNQYTIAKNLDCPSIIKPLTLEIYRHSYALVMEDFGGISLANYLQSGADKNSPSKPLPLGEFLEIAIQITQTLHYLYQQRVIHKDIKPANILINPETKKIKLIDFSIASLLAKETQDVENANALEGTLAYISPEQTGRMNRSVDYRSDFYNLGVTFYELLTGKLPFVSEDAMELLHCHLAKQAIPLHQINPTIPLVFSKIVGKLMAKNAEERYQSALGIQHDLEACLTQLQETGKIADFEIATRDISDRFIIPEKLYGRETEVEQILTAFEKVSMGITKLMLVAGFSGIGKTAVVHEVHKPIVRQRGYFITGKYDQFNRNIPLSAFVQAFRDLIGQLLSESDRQLQIWKDQIIAAVGDSGQVLIDVIPELKNIIGEQPPAPELFGTAAQNRFNLLWQKFVQVFTNKSHPLVIFLDDLQWADLASLNLLKLLMQDSGYLLILGAYRDNEVSPAHSLILTVDELVKTGATAKTIALPALKRSDINRLVADTLNCDLSLAEPLTKLVYQKTQGNPFFATQFLKALHSDRLITFNWDFQHWQCDMAQVESLSLTEDVVEFMTLQLQKLPTETQEVLKLAACVGAEFDLHTLAVVREKSPEAIATELWPALQEGFVIPSTKVYKFFTKSDSEVIPNAGANPFHRFLHDRVQQAAYSLIPDEQKQTTHLKIGQLLQEKLPDSEKKEKLFDIVGHFNLGIALITQPQEREALARLNLTAGQKAINSTAYSSARKFVQIGLDLLQANCWESQYELTLNLYIVGAVSAYLNADFAAMEQMAALVLPAARTVLDKVKIYEIQINARTTQRQMFEAIAVGRNALAELGVDFATEPDTALTEKALQVVAAQLQGRQIEALVNLPVMSEPRTIAAMQLLALLFPAIYQASPGLQPLLCSTMVNLSLQFGNAQASTIAYTSYGMVLSALQGEVERGYRFGRVAMSLLHQLNVRELKSLTLLWLGLFVLHRQEPLKATLPHLKEGYLAGMEVGDFLNAGYNIDVYFYNQFFAGVPLEDWSAEIPGYCAVLEKVKQDSPVLYMRMTEQMVENLRENVSQPDILSGEVYDELVILPKYQQNNELTGLAYLYTYKLMLAYLFSHYTNALDYITQAEVALQAVTGSIQTPVFYFYAGLTLMALISPETPVIDLNFTLNQIEVHQTTLNQWAIHAPMNHQHKVDLVAAEKCRVEGKNAAAIDLYDRAIAGAKKNGYIQEEALANELAAKFYLNWGKEKVAAGYMQEAYYGYAKWGAKAKIADLEKRYPQLLETILQKSHPTDLLTETIARSTLSSNQTSSRIGDALDLATLLQASQAISSEIDLNKLVNTLLKIVVANAGADKCVLLLLQDMELKVVARLDNGKSPQRLPSIPLESSPDVPISIINKVKRTLTSLVLADARIYPEAIADSYLQRKQPKSVLCSPILNQGQLIGILYLENNLTIGAFTRDRVGLLKFICSQAAISLENGRLYQESQIYAQQLEQSLEKLQISEARYRYLATATSQIIWLASPEGESLDTVHWIAYTGQSEKEVQGTGWLNALHPDDLEHTAKAWLQAVATKTQYKTEYRIRGADGVYRYFDVQGVPIFAEDGSVKEWIGTCNDIDARRRAEDKLREKSQQLEQTLQELQTMQLQLVQNEKMSALGNLVAGIAHEINNPVGFLKGNIQLALDYIQDLFTLIDLYQAKYPQVDPEIKAKINQIDMEYLREDLPNLVGSMREGIKRIQSISTSLRTFSRADKDYPVACNIHDGIDSTLMILKHRLKANEHHPEIQVIKDYGDLPHIKCYAGQLNQVFMNILSNAIDALEEANQGKSYREIHNQITIKTELSSDRKQVLIQIQDNGIGMTEALQDKIFEHLFTTKAVGKGTGLGLAIAHQIITEKHGGKIECESTLGQGTKFTLKIPILE